MRDSISPTDLFTPVEHVVLGRYFETEPLVATSKLTAGRAVDRLLPRRRVIKDMLDGAERRVAAVVADIVLRAVQDRLPQWACVVTDSAGERVVRPGRRPSRRAKTRTLLQPLQLFAINWATSRPGINWPEQYCVTYVPGYRRYVVTTSSDSPELFGACDLAIGHFPAHQGTIPSARQTIVDWWRDNAGAKFEEVTHHGPITVDDAWTMASEVWPDSVGPSYWRDLQACLRKRSSPVTLPEGDATKPGSLTLDRPKGVTLGYEPSSLYVTWSLSWSGPTVLRDVQRTIDRLAPPHECQIQCVPTRGGGLLVHVVRRVFDALDRRDRPHYVAWHAEWVIAITDVLNAMHAQARS